MSDSEGAFDDELLALAGAGSKKRKSKQGAVTKSKRRKQNAADVATSSDNTPESEEDDEAMPYPLEGKYKDDADRSRLMQLSEIEREEILAQRLEEIQRLQDKRNLDQMVKAQALQGGEDESVSKAAKRQHAVKGTTKEKTRKLDELRARRKAHDEKKRTKGSRSPKRDRSASPTDMEMSSEEDEDGQITKYEEEEERDRKLYSKAASDDDPITLADLNKCRLTRDQISKHCLSPWFEEYVKGAYVRYLIGNEKGKPIYRICEIHNLAADIVRPYRVNDQMIDQQFELKHGKSTKIFPFDKVSNAAFDEREFNRWMQICESDQVKLPTKRQLTKKVEQLEKLANQTLSESDIGYMLGRRRLIQQAQSGAPDGAVSAMERSRLAQALTLATRRQDWHEVKALTAQIDACDAAAQPPRIVEEDSQDRLARVNERNRKANQEAMRKVEQMEAEKKRLKRKLDGGLISSRTGTPDPNRRMHLSPGISRPGTPNSPLKPVKATEENGTLPALSVTGFDPVSSAENRKPSTIEDVELDLGDF